MHSQKPDMNMEIGRPNSPSSQSPFYDDNYGNPTSDHPEVHPLATYDLDTSEHATCLSAVFNHPHISKTDPDYNGEPSYPFDIAYTDLPIVRKQDIRPSRLLYDPQDKNSDNDFIATLTKVTSNDDPEDDESYNFEEQVRELDWIKNHLTLMTESNLALEYPDA